MRHVWIKILWSVLVILCILFATFVVRTLAMFDMQKIIGQSETSVVYDAEGNEISRLSGAEDRETVTLEEIPTSVVSAFISAEDLRFYRHIGFDPVRIGGALWKNIQAGDYAQGASTITQQLIKLTHLTSDKTVVRKAREIVLALKLETVLSKDEILQAYLNTVYFGRGAYGIEAASRAYFDKSAQELTTAQGALLAGVIKSPSYYAPDKDMDAAVSRRNRILQTMLDEGMLDEADAQSAMSEPVTIAAREIDKQYAWYVDQATVEAARVLDIDRADLITGGYRVFTAMRADMQRSAEALFADPANFPANAQDGTQAQAALIASDARTGAVWAVVGGRAYDVELGLNRATSIKRQPGSALKPISVYAAAVDRFGYLPSSFIDDTERDFQGDYHPHNVGDQYNGPVTLREALSRSLNVASVDLITRTGINAAYQYAEMLGADLENSDRNLSLALGSLTKGVSPMALNAAYASLANGGYAVNPHLITRIEDRDGQTLYEYATENRKVLRDTSARMITDMLITTAKTGTARRLGALPFPVAGKTGTVGMENGGNRDAWTVAFTPSSVVTMWMGFDNPDSAHKMSDDVSGSSLPCALATAFLKANGGAVNAGDFPMPNNLTRVLIDQRALMLLHRSMLASEYTPKSYLLEELYPRHVIPTEVSNVWVKPTKVYDLRAQYADGGAQITFTAVSHDAVYILYRDDGAEPVALASLTGEPGETLTFLDRYARTGSGYYVVPYEKTLRQEGIDLAGERSDMARLPGVIEWDEGATEDPDTPETQQNQETPLFG